MPWQKIRLRIKYGLKYAAVELPTLNRPKALNALTKDMLTRLAELSQELDQRPAFNVIILTGAGRAFSAGVVLSQQYG